MTCCTDARPGQWPAAMSGRLGPDYLRYSSSVTCSIHVTALPFRFFLNGDMAHGGSGRCSVPVLLVGLETKQRRPDGFPRPDHLHAAPDPNPMSRLKSDQPGAYAMLCGHPVQGKAQMKKARLKKRVNSHGAWSAPLELDGFMRRF